MEKGRAIEKFVKYMLITNLSLTTIETYERDVRLFLLALEVDNVKDINRETIEDYLNNLAEGQVKSSVIKKKYASIKAFIKFLAEQSIIGENPLVKPVKIPRNLTAQKLQVKKEEAELLLEKVLGDEELALRDKLVISLVLASGLSLVQIADYKAYDVKKIRFNGGIANDLRTKIAELLNEYLNTTKNERLFLNGKQQPLTYKYIRQLVNPYITQITESDKQDNFYIEVNH